MWTPLILASSLIVAPLHLGDAPPPLASVRRILLPATDEATRDLARTLAARARAGVDFAELARQHSAAPEGRTGGVLGTFVPGVLAPELDAFLFAAGVGEVSEPIALASGLTILQRVETHAAVLCLVVTGDAERRAQRTQLVTERLRRGDDFGAIARDLSDDRDSAERGGQYAIFERGAGDVLIKALAFQARVGDVFGPVDLPPLGLHWLKRVPLAEVEPALREDQFVRLRAILFQFDSALGADAASAHGEAAAKALADRTRQRLDEGADFRALAREATDDPGGRERDGDLGWIHRTTPGLSDAVRTAFLLPPGGATLPLRCPAGWVILKRER